MWADSSVATVDSGAEPLRIVLVDDHDMVRQCLHLLIERSKSTGSADGERPWRVVGEASNSEETRLVVARERPDLVLLDLHLGEDDGLLLLPELMRLCSCRVIILSGWVDDEVRHRALQAGACEVLEKNASPEELLTSIRRCS